MPIERNRIVEAIDAEPMLGESRDFRAKQPAAGGEDQPVESQDFFRAAARDNFHFASADVDGFGGPAHVSNINCGENIPERRRQRLRPGLIQPRSDNQPRFRRHEGDLQIPRQDAVGLAQARRGERRVHAGEAGAENNDSHVRTP